MSNQVNFVSNQGRIAHYIDGEQVSSNEGNFQEIFCPYDGKVLGEVPVGNAADVDKAVAAAKAAFPIWRDTHIKERVQVMFKLKSLMERDFEQLCHLISSENGKTLPESAGDVAKAIEVLEFGCSIPNLISGTSQEVSNNINCQISREALGVVACITPFNFPIMCPMWTIPIALTVGNTMVLKASEQVPLSAMKLAQLLKEAGLPNGVLNIVHGSVDVVNAICDHEDIEALSFVGSTKVAKIVYERAAKNHKRVLCLGGAKNHLIIMPDADLETAPKQIVDSGIGCAGQRCMAASALVAVGDCSKIIEQMKAYAESVRLGEGMGAIINKQSVERINKYINGAEKAGANIIVDGRGKNPEVNGGPDGYWVGPTIIDNVKKDSPEICEEIFGPVLSIAHVDSIEEAIELENNNPYGNACSIFTSHGPSADYMLKHAKAGMCGVNVGVPVPREPFSFGGWFDSKFGAGDITGEAGINFWTKDKKKTIKWLEPKNRNWMS